MKKKKIKKKKFEDIFNFSKAEDLYVQEEFTGAEDSKAGKTGDVPSPAMYDPRKVRWFSGFEFAQQVRYMVVLNWIKKYFDELSKRNRKGRLVLDLGCSYSFLYNFWRSNGNYFNWPRVHYHGVDANLKRIQKGRESFVKKKRDLLTYYLADITKPLVFKDKMDVIVCMETLEHIHKEKAFELISNIKRNLKKTGIVIMSSPNPLKEKGEKFVWKDSEKGHIYEWSFDEAGSFFGDLGLRMDEVCGILPRREFKRETKFDAVRDSLANYLPLTIVNSFLCVGDNVNLSKQWMMMLKLLK